MAIFHLKKTLYFKRYKLRETMTYKIEFTANEKRSMTIYSGTDLDKFKQQLSAYYHIDVNSILATEELPTQSKPQEDSSILQTAARIKPQANHKPAEAEHIAPTPLPVAKPPEEARNQVIAPQVSTTPLPAKKEDKPKPLLVRSRTTPINTQNTSNNTGTVSNISTGSTAARSVQAAPTPAHVLAPTTGSAIYFSAHPVVNTTRTASPVRLNPNAPIFVYGDSTAEQLGQRLGGGNLGIIGAGFFARKLAPVTQIPHDTKQILISIGYNDYSDAIRHPSQYESKLHKLFAQMRAQTSEGSQTSGAKIAILSIKGTTSSKTENDKIEKLNTILRDIAAKEGVQFVDLGDTSGIKCRDGIHFKDNKKYAELIKTILRNQLAGIV